MTERTIDTLTPDEIEELARHGWRADGSFTGNGVRYVRLRHRTTTRAQTVNEWRAELRRLEERDDE